MGICWWLVLTILETADAHIGNVGVDAVKKLYCVKMHLHTPVLIRSLAVVGTAKLHAIE